MCIRDRPYSGQVTLVLSTSECDVAQLGDVLEHALDRKAKVLLNLLTLAQMPTMNIMLEGGYAIFVFFFDLQRNTNREVEEIGYSSLVFQSKF